MGPVQLGLLPVNRYKALLSPGRVEGEFVSLYSSTLGDHVDQLSTLGDHVDQLHQVYSKSFH